MEVFNKYSELYDLLYKDKDYNKEVEYIVQKINNNTPPSKTILEFGSGTGIHGCALAKRGFEMTGVELSETMYMKAFSLIRSQSLEKVFSIFNEDIEKFRIEKKFGVVISLFHVISYLTDNEKLMRAFQNASSHLEPGGLFIFDVWYSPAVLTIRPGYRLKESENDDLKVYRFSEPEMRYNQNIVDVNYKLVVVDKKNNSTSVLHEKHSMRYFSIPEISFLAAQCSFDILSSEEFVTGALPSENTWGVCFILRKKNDA